ncbi:MAG: sugar phosphate isomerase/epimerase [Phycisphaerae bacterium]|nr:sugar phosphate isomerase/epimerase [Phycisphaerae bacterium]
MNQTRREWMTGTASTLAGLAVASKVERALAAGESDWPKVAMCDWSMGRTDPRAFDLGKQIGLDGIEVSIGSVQNDLWLRKTDVQKKYLDAAKKCGMVIPSVAMGLLNGVPLVSDPRAPGWVADTIDVTPKLGAKSILLAFFGKGEIKASDKDEMHRLVEILKELAPRAEKAGVILGLENYLRAEDNLDVIGKVGSKNVQVYYDVFNSDHKGHDVIKEIKLMGKDRICQVHFKEGGSYLGGSGKIDWPAVAAALKGIGYRKWLVLETSNPSKDIVADTRKNLAYLKKLFTA